MTSLTVKTAQEKFGAVSTRFAQHPSANDDLTAGVAGGFSSIGFKGKVWSIRHKGEEIKLMRPDGDGPMNSIEIVIVKAPSVVSKTWYEGGYVEDSKAPPDCSSNNGVTPLMSSPKKQAATCSLCPHNQWGSAMRDGVAGKGKACADVKRLAVVPQHDINNEVYGGPMLLRVPSASLQELTAYGYVLQKLGYPAAGVATRVSFDTAEAYPKFKFSPIRALTDEEVDMVLALREDARVGRILSEAAEPLALTAPAQEATPQFEQPALAAVAPKAAAAPAAAEPAEPAKPAPGAGFGGGAAPAAPKAASKAAAKPVTSKVAPVAAAPEPTGQEGPEVNNEDFEAGLDADLANLLPAVAA